MEEESDQAIEDGAAMKTDDEMPDFPMGYDQLAASGANGSNGLGPDGMPLAIRLTPEQLEWARRQFNEEETLAALRDLEEKGGLTSEEFLRGLERAAKDND